MIRHLLLGVLPILAGWASSAQGAVAVADHDRLWRDHAVPFVICEAAESPDAATPPITSGCDEGGTPLAPTEAAKVRDAVAQWNDAFGTELRFYPVAALSRGQRGVLFSQSKRATLCSTDRIGRPEIARRTNVRIGSHCNGFAATATPVGTVLHEMMHVAGFYHEQQRPDRDAYLHARVPDGLVSQLFDMHGANQWAKGNNRHSMRMLTPYDFGSIMHYPIRDRRKAAITLEGLARLDAQGLSTRDPGRRDAMSANDIAGIRILYGTRAPTDAMAAGKSLEKREPAPL
jgi:hypothetical protein